MPHRPHPPGARASHRLLRCIAALAAAGLLCGLPARPAAAAETLRVLILAVDGNQALPRSLRHHENNQVTNTTWSSAADLEHFAFDRATSFGALFDEMSYGELDVTGDAVLISLPYDANQLTWQQWADLADAEATSLGYDLSTYDRFLYQLPFLPLNAPATGIAVSPRGMCAQPTYVELSCLFHELGHTIGLQHASELQAGGSLQGQGDVSDGLMGLGFGCHVNAVNKYLAGWLVGNRLEEVTSPGFASYVLAPQSSQANARQVLRIKMGDLYTYVSYRDTNGFDQELLGGLLDVNGDDVANSVVIHRHTAKAGGDAVYVEALKAGDTHNGWGVTVSVQSIAGGQATVSVTRGSWAPTPPQVSISPYGVSSQPWLPGNFTLEVTNVNPAGTPFDAFYEIELLPPGAGWDLGWTTFAGGGLAPGETRQHPFWVQPPGNLPLGLHPFVMQVNDPDGDSGSAATHVFASFTAIGPLDTTPPSVPTNPRVYSVSPSSVLVIWDAANDALSGVGHYEVRSYDPGSPWQLVGTADWFALVDEQWQPGRRYSVRAVDKALNPSGWTYLFPYQPPIVCGLGFELVALLPPLMWLRSRRRRRRA